MSYYSGYTGAEVDALLAQVEALGVMGTANLVEGEADGQVIGLALSFTPTKCVLTVEVPDESSEPLVILATLWGSPSADGFAYLLTAYPESPNYKLHYHLAP